MPGRIITLTTDFGTSDHYVGAMKGVIASICPTAQVIDITHEIRAFEISEGAFAVAQAYRYFPKKTIHVVVVDPGVGTARRPILVEAAGQYFIAPDNGVLSMVYGKEKAKIREITALKYFLKPVSRTFHGRDIFSPCAAHLAKGATPASLGKLIDDYLKITLDQPVRTGKRIWTGTILKVDRFGNLITNFHFDQFSALRTHAFEVAVGTRKLTRLSLTFADAEDQEPFVIFGSTGFLEVACNQASAARALGCGVGAPVEITFY